ncbi:hypothetical protein [Streptomyces sp. 7-21]|jgi:uncharacterized phage infection (PIP) family protein YhgE|uniref:hypothetical protein n=1 Tax=Streptomyces sp. 7-21 TaxID=2802283 RepID=UPI00191F2178|nr:hypothetical protein [Streptomyces sp. 7-21]MBL1066195.1 hypothetical protein [Streptomyces sp. 7-21]
MPQGNVSITYADIEEATQAMKSSASNTLNPAVQEAKRAFDHAIANYLTMPQTNAVLEQKFTEFYNQLVELVANVENFADQFTQIKEGMQQMDSDIANSILNPPSQ